MGPSYAKFEIWDANEGGALIPVKEGVISEKAQKTLTATREATVPFESCGFRI